MSEPLPELLDAKGLQAELGVTRAAAEAIMRRLPVVQFEDLRKVYVKRSDILAATLLGAAAAIRERTSAALDPNEQAELDAVIGQAKELLGADGFRAAWSDGTALSIDRAVEIALS